MNAVNEFSSLRDDAPQTPPMPRCTCGKWRVYVGNYDADGYTFRCSGCLRAVSKCRC